MSDDGRLSDSASIVSNPFARPVLTAERLAYYEKIHQENPIFQGPPWIPPSPEPPTPKRKPRTRQILDGIGRIQYLQGLRRLPSGRIYSQRLEEQRLQAAAAAGQAAPTPPPADKPTRAATQSPTPPAPVSKRPKAGSGTPREKSGARLRKTRAGQSAIRASKSRRHGK